MKAWAPFAGASLMSQISDMLMHGEVPTGFIRVEIEQAQWKNCATWRKAATPDDS
jgi:hypothetical protein